MNILDFDSIPTPAFEDSTPIASTFPNTLLLQPEGYETCDTESMSSYLCRLAEAASEMTVPFAKRLLRHHLSPDALPKTLPSTANAWYTVNGFDKFGSRFCSALDIAAGGEIAAELLTFFPIKNLSDKLGRHLSKVHREWCHECWREDILMGRTPYIRLYWLIQPVRGCCIHNIKLQTFCAKCGNRQNCMSSFPRQWICDNCGFELHKNGSNEAIPTTEAWMAHSIYRLIDRVYRKKYFVSEYAIRDGIQRLLLTNNETYSSLSEKLNISKITIEDAGEGRCRPFFSLLVDLCYRINIPIDQFVLDSDILNPPVSWRPYKQAQYVKKKNISKKKKLKIEVDLKAILRTQPQPPPRISQIAKKHNIEYTVLEYHFPKESNEIRRRWLMWSSSHNLGVAKDRIEKLITGVLDLARHNVYPSDRKLRDLKYVLPSDLRRDEIIVVLRALQSSYKIIGLFDAAEDISEKKEFSKHTTLLVDSE